MDVPLPKLLYLRKSRLQWHQRGTRDMFTKTTTNNRCCYITCSYDDPTDGSIQAGASSAPKI